jgi:hypothetical protein
VPQSNPRPRRPLDACRHGPDPEKERVRQGGLNDDPLANAAAVNEAWRAAGMAGSISGGLVNNLKFRMGLSGSLRRRRTTGRRRGRRTVQVQGRANESTPTTTRRRSSELMGLELEIDRLLRKVVEIGQLPDVEDELQSARHRLYAGMVAGF